MNTTTPATIRIDGREVNRLGFGAMQLPGPGVWGEPRNPDGAREVLRRVLDCGIRLIDTSWYYGPHVANRFIAETLHPYPNDLVLATKLGGARTPDKGWVPALSPEALQRGCEEDLRGLRLDRCHYVHLRHIPNEVPFLESLDAMIELRAQGKIGHIALSNVSLAQLEQARSRTSIAGVQNLYNVVLGERSLAGVPHTVVQDQDEIVDLCAANGMAYMPFFPLALPGGGQPPSPTLTAIAENHGATQAQVAIAWLLARSPAMVPIPGTSSLAHLDENWAARELALTADEIATIAQARVKRPSVPRS